MGVAGNGKGAVGTSVERMLHGNDLVVGPAVLEVGIFNGRLQGAFYRFRAAVGKEDPVHTGNLFDPVGRACRRLVIEIVGGMDDLVQLGFDRVIEFLMVVAKSEYRDTRHEVQVFFPVDIIQIRALAPVQYDLVAVISMEQVLLRLVDDCFHFILCHGFFSPLFSRQSSLRIKSSVS